MIFDGPWIDWYLRKFAGRPLVRGPLSGPRLFLTTTVDIPSLGAAVLKKSPAEIDRASFPVDWFGDVPHSHRAIDDATGYAHLLLRLLKR